MAALVWENPEQPLVMGFLEGHIPGPQLAVLLALAGIISVAFPESERKRAAARRHMAKTLLFGFDPTAHPDTPETQCIDDVASLLEKLDQLPGIETMGLRRDLPSAATSEADAVALAPRLSDMAALPAFWACGNCGTAVPRGGDCEVCCEHNYAHPVRAKSAQVQLELNYVAQFLPALAAAEQEAPV